MSSGSDRYRTRQVLVLIGLVVVIAASIGLLMIVLSGSSCSGPASCASSCGSKSTPAPSAAPSFTDEPSGTGAAETNAPTEPAFTDVPTDAPTAPPAAYLPISPHSSANASLYGFYTELMVNGSLASSYTAGERVVFAHNDDYCAVDGVLSFRGSTFRQDPYFGTASVSSGKLQRVWQHDTFSVGRGEGGKYTGVWTGTGWTGQALLVRWDKETKAVMNMFDSAKNKDGLVEAICPCMDGNIYFYDAETGEATRNKLVFGVPFKGCGSVDPRGWPLLYVGQGDHYNTEGKASKAYVISLIDGKVLATIGTKPDSFAVRSWHAYDSAPIIDANTDTLFYPGENGILYRVKLNTRYDKASGTVSMTPSDTIKLRYQASRTKNNGYWLGYEASAVAWRNYLYLCDNAGFMQCVDASSMKTLWVQDVWDDTNATPCFEEDKEKGTGYLYVGNTLDNKADASGQGKVAFFKIDACTGEIIWQKEYTIYSTSNVTGGFQGSAVLGRGELEGLVITTYSSVGGGYAGYVVAYDKETGDEVWKYQVAGYTWCSPVAMYDAEGKAYIVVCNSNGDVYLLNGKGQLLDSINLESNIEASPVAFDNMIVIGTRIKGIFGLKIY